ncbi:putative glycosidase [Helianthus annuus]|nr:putative glycosidase [Helianthus annuus]
MQKGVCLWVVLVSFCFIFVDSRGENGRLLIDGKSRIAETDNDFVCATMDWWPPEKCDYGTCSWDHSSLLNVTSLFLHSSDVVLATKVKSRSVTG